MVSSVVPVITISFLHCYSGRLARLPLSTLLTEGRGILLTGEVDRITVLPSDPTSRMHGVGKASVVMMIRQTL